MVVSNFEPLVFVATNCVKMSVDDLEMSSSASTSVNEDLPQPEVCELCFKFSTHSKDLA